MYKTYTRDTRFRVGQVPTSQLANVPTSSSCGLNPNLTPNDWTTESIYKTVTSSLATGGDQWLTSYAISGFKAPLWKLLESGVLVGSKLTTDLIMKRLNVTTAFNPYINSTIYTAAAAAITDRSVGGLIVSFLSSLGSQCVGDRLASALVSDAKPY